MPSERARAKINLTLRIAGRRADGYHNLESLVVFAGAADLVTLTPGPGLTLRVEGPTAAAAGAMADNLVLRAARALSARIEGLTLGAFVLSKRLPVAAGLGGGSADAAAALRLLARANGVSLDDARLLDAAAEVGADTPVCVASRARVMRGVGERLGPPLSPPPLFAVLVNSGVAVPTGAVFSQLGLRPGQSRNAPAHPLISDEMDLDRLIAALRGADNDLEEPAAVIAPSISSVMRAISATAGCKLARMSGSGGTCFGLFETRADASEAARSIRRAHPSWWAKATVLR